MDSEELPEQSQSGKNKANKCYEKRGGEGYIEHEDVKTISIARFQVAILIDDPVKLTSDFVLKCQLGKSFDKFRNIMKNKNIDGLFKKSYFGYFHELLEDHTLHFQMSIVYGLLKRRIKYAGDDKDSKEGKKKMDEIWINYYRMLVCFGLKEFSIVMGLRCDHLEEPLIKEIPLKRSKTSRTTKPHPLNRWKALSKQRPTKTNKQKEKIDGLLNITRLSYKVAWAFEVIPPLRKQLDYPDEVSHPRILRWLAAKSSTRFNKADHFNPLDDTIWVVHPWNMPTEQELGMTYFITLDLIDAIADPTVELIKKELDGATSIKRAVRSLHNQPTTIDLGASSEGVAGGVVDVGSSHPDVDVAFSREDENVDSQEKINMFEITPYTELMKLQNAKYPKKKKIAEKYTMYVFDAQDFRSMTAMRKWYVDKYIDEFLCLMRGRQVACPNAYDAANRIMDLNLYNNYKNRYN
ncbi:hypothetical protein P3S68_008404 [Capsicum galapagoense]